MTEIAMQGKPRRSEILVINDENDTPSLLNPMSGKIFLTNRVGRRIIEMADGGHSVDEIVDEIARTFKAVTRAAAHDDVVTFLRQGTEQGLVAWGDN